jgi:hypothetical protein
MRNSRTGSQQRRCAGQLGAGLGDLRFLIISCVAQKPAFEAEGLQKQIRKLQREVGTGSVGSMLLFSLTRAASQAVVAAAQVRDSASAMDTLRAQVRLSSFEFVFCFAADGSDCR